jgi:parallel beta-helix repeat protein
VVGRASLNLSFTTIRQIHDTSITGCKISGGTAICVGLSAFNQIGDANISDVIISDYSNHAIAVMGEGSRARILRNHITGYGEPPKLGQAGVAVINQAGATIRDNTISNNLCDPACDSDCGPDPINQAQSVGIFTFDTEAPIEIEGNTVFHNDVGIYLYLSNGCRTISNNTLINNRFFGIVIQNGINTTSNNTIYGGAVGEAVVADTSDSTGTFHNDRITETTTSETQEVESNAFTATVINSR